MKNYISKYGDTGYKTDDGLLRVTTHYDKKGVLAYIRVENHNGKTVAIKTKSIKEMVDMMSKYIKY